MDQQRQSSTALRNFSVIQGRLRMAPGDSQVSNALATLAFSLQDAAVLVRASPLHVLLVDDCPIQQLLACALLARWKIMPQMASDGLEAVLLVGEQEFDIVLMDVEMPVMDGLTATARIRQNERRARRAQAVPVVAYTAGALASDEGRWRMCGMNAVLKKPSDTLEMGACLERWCPSKVAALQHQSSARPCQPVPDTENAERQTTA